MLAHGRHGIHAVAKGAVHTGRQQGWHFAGRCAHGAPTRARSQLRVGPQVGHVVHAGVGDLGQLQPFDHLGRREGGKEREDVGLQRVPVGVALGIAAKARVARQFGLAQHLVTKGFPFAFVLQAQHDRAAVPRHKRPVRVDAGVRSAGARRRCCALVRVIQRVAHPLTHGFEHGHVNVTALTRAAAQQQRRQNVGVRIHAGGNVGHRDAGLGRRLGRTGHRQEAGLALDEQVIGLFVAIRAIGAVARDVADDELGVVGLQRLVRQAHARSGAGSQVLHHHVGRGQQLQQRLFGLRPLDVERQAFLAAVKPGEVR